jgi:hypothetical protein
MEDWMEYCDQQMDSKTLINVPEIKTSTWRSKDTKIINSNNPAEIASILALNEWSYSDDAVIAVNAETKYSDSEIQGSVQGNIEANTVEEKRFILPQINIITPQFEDFTVPDGYTYMKARLWWECFYFSVDMPGGFFQLANISSPAGDPNLELFCRHKDKWMQVAATLGWNQKSGMDLDYTGSYIYETGPWRVAVTDVPTHSANKISQNIDSQNVEKHHNIGPVGFGRYGTFFDALKNSRNVQYKVDITMFPGTIVELPDVPMHDCDEAEFKLTWDNPDVNLGLTVIGPGGEEVLSVSNESRTDNQEMILKGLGECLIDEKYKVSVFAMDDISSPVDFKVEYVWKQGLEEKTSSSLTSATEGAVLASQLNAPMLYIESSKIPKVTQDVLYKLGVKNIYLVDINNRRII